MLIIPASAMASCLEGTSTSSDYVFIKDGDICDTEYSTTTDYKIADDGNCGDGYTATSDYVPDNAATITDTAGTFKYDCTE
jgi:hypothetical protein